MKANLQSNVMSLETSHLFFGAWNNMPDYALEYVVERKRVSSRLNEQTAIDLQFSPRLAVTTSEPTPSMAATADATSATPKMDALLTPRQRDVFDLIVQGMSNKEIARSLGLAEGTVKIHIKALFAKLGVRRRAAVAVAGTRVLSAPERGSC